MFDKPHEQPTEGAMAIARNRTFPAIDKQMTFSIESDPLILHG
jgi:hypothetical protein